MKAVLDALTRAKEGDTSKHVLAPTAKDDPWVVMLMPGEDALVSLSRKAFYALLYFPTHPFGSSYGNSEYGNVQRTWICCPLTNRIEEEKIEVSALNLDS